MYLPHYTNVPANLLVLLFISGASMNPARSLVPALLSGEVSLLVTILVTRPCIAFGIGMLISGTATALYYSKEQIRRALKIHD